MGLEYHHDARAGPAAAHRRQGRPDFAGMMGVIINQGDPPAVYRDFAHDVAAPGDLRQGVAAGHRRYRLRPRLRHPKYGHGRRRRLLRAPMGHKYST